MQLTPGLFHSLRFFLPFTLVAILMTTPVCAQQRGGGGGRSKQAAASKNTERVRRAAEAVSLLIETADGARLFDDLFYRARIQALAADALWLQDERQARATFRRAWEAATASDLAEQEESARETGVLPSAVGIVTDARDEVLSKAAARDTKLAEMFLRALVDDKNFGKSSSRTQTLRPTPWRELSAGASRRLALAFELLNSNDARRAAEIAAPVTSEGVSADLITFILRLRERSPLDADALYLRLLRQAATDTRTDANAVLLLSSPIISPTLLVVVDEFGSLQFRALPAGRASVATQAAMTQRTQSTFFNLAANVLLRPSPARDEAITMLDLISRFYATGRLLPAFESAQAQYSAFAPALRARHSELFNQIEAARRDQISSQFELSSLTHSGHVDPLRSETERLARAEDVSERRRLIISIIKTAVRNRSWDRARRAAAEMENMDERQAALSFIAVHEIKDISRAYRDEKEDDYEAVADYVRSANLPPYARAWGLAEAAVIASRRKSDATISQTIISLIDEAEGHAARVGERTLERVAAYGVVVAAAARLDQERAWTLLRELVKAANAVEDYTGDEDSLAINATTDSVADEVDHFSVEAEAFRLDGIFATMARLDYKKALMEARALERDVPRAFAQIAIARTMLEK